MFSNLLKRYGLIILTAFTTVVLGLVVILLIMNLKRVSNLEKGQKLRQETMRQQESIRQQQTELERKREECRRKRLEAVYANSDAYAVERPTDPLSPDQYQDMQNAEGNYYGNISSNLNNMIINNVNPCN